MVQPLLLIILVPILYIIPSLLVLLESLLLPQIIKVLLFEPRMLSFHSVVRVEVLVEPLFFWR